MKNAMTEQAEIWKDIEGFPDYEISNQGRVLSRRTSQPKIMKGCITYSGIGNRYRQYSLQKDHSTPQKKIGSHLVAEAFLGEWPTNCSVRYINGNLLDDRASNLEYVEKGKNGLISNSCKINKEILRISKTRSIEFDDIALDLINYLKEKYK